MSCRDSIPLPLTLALVLVGLTQSGQGTEATAPMDLSTLFKVGSLVQDRNGDSFADLANAWFVLPPSPTAEQIAAAANIAARVGLGTTAMDIPVKRGLNGPVIAVTTGANDGPETFALGPDHSLIRFTSSAPS